MSDDERKKVIVSCLHPNGLMLRLYKPHEGVKETETVEVKSGDNYVDEAFMKGWVEENQNNDLYLNGTVSVVEPPKAQEGGEPGVDHIVERPDKESSIDAPAPEKEEKPPAEEPPVP